MWAPHPPQRAAQASRGRRCRETRLLSSKIEQAAHAQIADGIETIGFGFDSDFDFGFERMPHERGDRVKITMSGKFLPYRYYGNQQGIPEYGYKED